MQERITWSEYLLVPLEEALLSVVAYLPSIIAALIILIVGWIFALFVRWFLAKSLKAARFDSFARRTRLEVMWTSVGAQSASHAVVARAVYWLVLLLVALSVVNTLEIAAMQTLSARLIGFLPDLVAGVLVLVVGLFVAGRVRRLLERGAEPLSERAKGLVTTIGYGLMVAFVIDAALRKLGIDTSLLENLFTLLVGCLGLGLAIAFGIGGKDRAAEYLERWRSSDSEGGEDAEG